MINSGDTAWLLMSTALVMLMIPGLALFYGGMVRGKNVLSTLMMSFVLLGVIGVLWVLYGYSLSFGSDIGGLIGGLDFLGLKNVGQGPSDIYATTVPHLAFTMFQGMFAIIAVALWTGAVVERIKFSAFLILAVLWFTIVYCPVAHWVWGDGGWLAELGALDFAGGTVVHIAAGMSALALALIVGPRKGFKEREPMEPHNITIVVLGAGLLWFGWFGFNPGSTTVGDGSIGYIAVTTNLSAAAGAIVAMAISWIVMKKPDASMALNGALAGLVSITAPCDGVTPAGAIIIGIVGGALVVLAVLFIDHVLKIDDPVGAVSVHGVCGTWGTLATGLFNTESGLLYGGGLKQLSVQALGAGAAFVWAFGLGLILFYAISKTIGLRVTPEEELKGLDIGEHGMEAYSGFQIFTTT